MGAYAEYEAQDGKGKAALMKMYFALQPHISPRY